MTKWLNNIIMASVVVIVVLLLFAGVLCSVEWWMYLTEYPSVSVHHPWLKAILSHYNSLRNIPYFSELHCTIRRCVQSDLFVWVLSKNCLTLVDLRFDAQNSYLFTYNTFIKILYMFRALPCSSSGGLRRNCIYAVPVSTLSAGDCPVNRLRNNQRHHIYNYDVDLLKMSRVMLETCRGF